MEEIINPLRTVFVVLGLLCFLGICFWAWSAHAKQGFEEAARLPFSEDDDAVSSTNAANQRKEG